MSRATEPCPSLDFGRHVVEQGQCVLCLERFDGREQCYTCSAWYPVPVNARGVEREGAYNVHTGSQRHRDAVAKAVGRV